MEERKVTLFLMTLKGFNVLKTLSENKKTHMIDNVVIGTDKNISNDYSEEIRHLCSELNIRYNYRKDAGYTTAYYSIAVSWRWMLDNKGTRLIVLHDSLLPEYRGFAPLVNALKNGEKEIGVTAIFAGMTYDTGDIIYQAKTEIEYPVTINEVIEKASEMYNRTVLEIFEMISSGKQITAEPQDEDAASYSLWLDDEDYKIDWTKSSAEIRRLIDSVGKPYKGASSYLKGNLVRILSAEEFPDVKIVNRTPGKIIFRSGIYPVVVCGEGLLKLTRITDGQYNDILPFKELRLRFK